MAVVREVSAQNNNLQRSINRFFYLANIKNPQTRELHTILRFECLAQVQADHNRAGASGAQAPNERGVDLSWVGASQAVDNYNRFRTFTPVRGLSAVEAFLEDREAGYPAAGEVDGEAISIQQCSRVWEVFRVAVLEEADNDTVSWMTRVGQFFGNTGSEDTIIEAYVTQTPVNRSATTEAIQQNPEGAIEATINVIGKAYAVLEMTRLALKTNLFVDVLIIALPMFQAYVLMLVIMALPFGFILSGYSLGFIFQATVLVFAISFWPALWALVAWADETMARALFPRGDGLFAIARDLVENLNLATAISMFSHNLVTMTLYILTPVIFSWVMLPAGANAAGQAGSAVGNSVTPGAIGTGGAGTTGTTGVRGQGNRAIGNITKAIKGKK